MKNILVVFGTRPEVIKLAPVIQKLVSVCNVKILHTGQHKGLVAPLFSLFNIKPDIDLHIMEPGQDLFQLTERLLPRLKAAILDISPDYVMVQGDTTSSYLAALSAFYLKIPVLHVEAGLRSHSLYEPFPEELNRKQITGIARYHFAPTELNRQNLLNEGVQEQKILVTGNTVVDALKLVLKPNKSSADLPDAFRKIPKGHRIALLTLHRRENHGTPIKNVLNSIKNLLDTFHDLHVILPVHPNPDVKQVVEQFNINNKRFKSIPPVPYQQFVEMMSRTHLILTDSGGLQEEGAALGKKVFVLRNKTERQELIESGLGELAGTETQAITTKVSDFLRSAKPLKRTNVYGDGRASERIRDFITDQL